jgi:hypothetical protein
VSDPSSIRVADADRERVAGELREHHVAGRLSAEEFEQRVEAAYKASTRAELDALTADLPMSPASVRLALDERRMHLRRRLIQEGGGAVGLITLCVGIWAASGADGSFWPIWVIIATMIPILRNAWQLFGPAPDLEAVEANLDARRRQRVSGERGRRHRRLSS